jgi:ATP-binding cassette subfamily B protein
MNQFFDKNSEDYKQNAIGLAKVESLYFPSMALLIGLSTLLTIMIGGLYAVRGNHGVDIGTIAEFVMYINLLTFPVSAIGWTASMIQRAAASQKRLNEFLDTESVLKTAPQPVSKSLAGQIDFQNVHFIYPNTGIHALKNFNLTIRKGERIAVIGHTGSGKTTIAQLLLRMYDPTSGKILVDGIDLRDFDIHTLRQQISYTPQDVFLFSDTIANNIGFGVFAKQTVNAPEAAHFASVDKEIEGFQKKYETMVGERGVTLSGGQKQRISIARALIKDSPIIVFDDCLSAVDSKTEKQVLANLNHFLENRTVIIITHRILSLFDFDKIIVLDEGQVIEEGKHDELLARKGYYTFLYEQQQQEKQKDSGSN